ETERFRNVARNRPVRPIGIERNVAAEERVWIEDAEHDGGIGHRGVCAALTITGRTRHGARRSGADTQGAPDVDPRDPPPPPRDRLDVERRPAERLARDLAS